jgi:hypothetical protein
VPFVADCFFAGSAKNRNQWRDRSPLVLRKYKVMMNDVNDSLSLKAEHQLEADNRF